MTRVLWELILITTLLLSNAALVMSEFAIISSNKARLKRLEEEGDEKAGIALSLSNSPASLIAAIQIGITLIGVLMGAIGEATFAEDINTVLRHIPGAVAYSQMLSVTITVLLITYFSLLIGELLPKRIALNNPEQAARNLSGLMLTMARLCAPVVQFLNFSCEKVLNLLDSHPSREPPITGAEIELLVEQGAKAGIFKDAEREIISGALKLDEMKVDQIMTPRNRISWLNIDDSPESIVSIIRSSQHERFPVGKANLDNLLGIINARDVILKWSEGKEFDLKSCVYNPHIIPENKNALSLLKMFKLSGIHMAVVVDEYGSVRGLVSISDLVEIIMGELPEAGETSSWEIIEREDGSWLVDAITPIAEFRKLFELETLPGEDQGDYRTLGGFVIHELMHIPHVTEHFHKSGLRFEVVDMHRNRINKILVSRDSSSAIKEETAVRTVQKLSR